jgi:hypothetical protein
MIKLSKVFLVDVAPSTGAATVNEAEYDPTTGLVYYGEDKVTHISRVREATHVKTSTQPATPAPIVRKVPPRKP